MKAHILIGKNKEELYSLFGAPDYSEFGGIQLIYITRIWFIERTLMVDLDIDGIVESVYTIHKFKIFQGIMS
ncbi:hypothetical protein [Epilithonimonas sp.]|uniref:hypothetical protein n=1 Tax=Epilithonimonas sp. TaxID=2894511 RepID=UPI002899A7E0|nr:hypothetical protein [Epilithonimonas sp.]